VKYIWQTATKIFIEINDLKYPKRCEEGCYSYSNVQKAAVGAISSECDTCLLIETGRLSCLNPAFCFWCPYLKVCNKKSRKYFYGMDPN